MRTDARVNCFDRGTCQTIGLILNSLSDATIGRKDNRGLEKWNIRRLKLKKSLNRDRTRS